jgi:hypothetical protein
VLTRPGGPEDKEIETLCLNTGAKFQRPQHPILPVRALKVLQVFGSDEIQFVFRATVVDLVFG